MRVSVSVDGMELKPSEPKSFSTVSSIHMMYCKASGHATAQQIQRTQSSNVVSSTHQDGGRASDLM